jgi:hypothetical protein
MRNTFFLRICATAAAGVVLLQIGCQHKRLAQGTTDQRRIAEACLAMLRSSLTNESDIVVTDPRIPEVIRALHPVDIQLTATDVVVTRSGVPSEYHLNRRLSEPRIWILYAAGGTWGGEHRELLRISE